MPHTTNRHSARIASLLRGKAPIKWLFAGDSITQGAFHTLGFRHYPELFAERIRWELKRKRDCILVTGVDGWRISDLAGDLEWSLLQYKPQVVSLNFGMNDCAQGADGCVAFENSYRKLLGRLEKASNPAVILQTPNAIAIHASPSRSHLPLYAASTRRVASEHGAVLVDHHKIWGRGTNAIRMKYWLSDDIHPNEYGHRMMARTQLRELGLFSKTSTICQLLVP
jgi:acyl-CoA thioesterase-1